MKDFACRVNIRACVICAVDDSVTCHWQLRLGYNYILYCTSMRWQTAVTALTFQMNRYSCLPLPCVNTVQRQTAVTAHFSSEQVLLFAFARDCGLTRLDRLATYFGKMCIWHKHSDRCVYFIGTGESTELIQLFICYFSSYGYMK